MADEIRLQFTPTEKELLAVVQAKSIRSWSFRGLVIFILSMLIYVGVQALVYESTVDLLCFGLLPTVVIAAILAVFTYSNPLFKRRIRKEPKYLAEQTWQFAEDKVVWKTQYAESNNDWKNFVKVAEFKDFFVLYFQSNMFAPIPKRALADEAETTRLRDLLRRKITKWE